MLVYVRKHMRQREHVRIAHICKGSGAGGGRWAAGGGWGGKGGGHPGAGELQASEAGEGGQGCHVVAAYAVAPPQVQLLQLLQPCMPPETFLGERLLRDTSSMIYRPRLQGRSQNAYCNTRGDYGKEFYVNA